MPDYLREKVNVFLMRAAQKIITSLSGAAAPIFEVRFAAHDDEIAAAQRLRYAVFVAELGADGPLIDHAEQREIDAFDAYADHLLLHDKTRPAGETVVGVYRLLSQQGAAAAGQFYCAAEFDLTPLQQSGQRLLELGRSCLHPAYRGGGAMLLLWQALAQYVQQQQIDILFGVASFHGTDLDALAAPLGLLAQRHLAPPALRVRAIGAGARQPVPLPADQIDRLAAMRQTPALIKAYLRLGGMVGAGVYLDHAFNTTDVCLILPVAGVNATQRQILDRQGRHG